MPTYDVKARKTGPYVVTNVEADSREGAIQQVLDTAAEGEEIEVFETTEIPGEPGAPTGVTGATGPAARVAGPNTAKPTRAQLNEMSKDELLAVAEKEGAEVAAHWNKADIVDAIVKHK